jgi:hypothetical protein
MLRLKPFRWAAALALALALAPGSASAQDPDTLTISGTFGMDELYEPVGADLAEVFSNGHEHAWTLTLYGVTYSNDVYYNEYVDESNYEWQQDLITRVHATSFDFEFFGPDAAVLNAVVSSQLTDAFFEVRNVEHYYGFYDTLSQYSTWGLRLSPAVLDAGVSFDCYPDAGDLFPTDQSGYPVVEPRLVGARLSVITDSRSGDGGAGVLFSRDDRVGIDMPLPALPPSLTIGDGSVREGNKGTTRLGLTVTLSQSTSDTVTVKYATADGTAQKKSDYAATSGTLTFQPGQTSRTISVSIKGDRKREANETFTVQLSNAIGATISDGVASVTILNDD